MATPVEVPQLGNSVEECLITRWRQARRGRDCGRRPDRGNRDRQDDVRSDRAGRGHAARVVLRRRRPRPGLHEPLRHRRSGREQSSPSGRLPEERRGRPPPRRGPVAPTSASSPWWFAKRRRGGQSPSARARAGLPRAHNFYPASIAGSGPGGRVLEHDLRRASKRAHPRNHGRSRRSSAAAGPWAGHRASRNDCAPDARVAGVHGPVHAERIRRRDRARVAARAREDAHGRRPARHHHRRPGHLLHCRGPAGRSRT